MIKPDTTVILKEKNMLFNILSIILFYVLVCIIVVLVYMKFKGGLHFEDDEDILFSVVIILTIVFMLIMSWQNWWR